jgi:RimJ/RimL family protein N-acetyltransferase
LSAGRLLFSYKGRTPKGGKRVKELGEQWIPQIAKVIKILNPSLNPTIQVAEDWVRKQMQEGRKYYGITEKGALLSVASLVKKGRKWWLGMVYTTPKWRRKGLATEVVSKVLREAKALGADEVLTYADCSNKAAIGLLKKVGFRVVQEQKS